MTRERTLDALEVRIEVAPALADALGASGAGGAAVAALRARVAERLRGVTGIHVQVSLVAPGTLPRSEGGKFRRVLDRRTLA